MAVMAAIVFFFGVPIGGIAYVYYMAQSTLSSSATKFAVSATAQILGEQDFEEFEQLGTLTLDKTVPEEDFQAIFEKWGEFRSQGEFAASRGYVIERDNMTWQVITLTAPVEFENGSASLKFTAARRSTVLEDWRIEEFEILVSNVE